MQSHAKARNPSSDSLPFEIHIGDLSHLWEETARAPTPRHLVVTPTDLHQRNLEERLRKHQWPHSNFEFRRIGELAGDITGEQTPVSTALDRVDRLALIREVIEEADGSVYDHLAAALGVPLEKHIERLERTRSELELVTGFHPIRMEAFVSQLGDQRDPSTEETLDLLAGVSRLHRDLQRRLSSNGDSLPTQAVSKTSLLCRALRIQQATQSAWTDVYPSIETLSVTGTSMLTAPIADLCRLVSQTTDVDVHVHLREASGPQIRRQLAVESDIEQFGTQEVFEWR